MSIMEKNLPVAESLGEGDMVRIVTGGNSKQIDASQIGGGMLLVVQCTFEDLGYGELYTLQNTYREIFDVLNNGGIAFVVQKMGDTDFYMFEIAYITQTSENSYKVRVGNSDYTTDSVDGYPSYSVDN